MLNDDNMIMKKNEEIMQMKLKNIRENNILIPKEKDKAGSNVHQQEEDQSQQEMINHIQEEVRKLHYQLIQKD